MISAILGRLAPYFAAALLASAGLNWWLGHELLAKQEALGAALQAGPQQALTDALAGSRAVQKAQQAADAGTIADLRRALGREQSAYNARQGDLNASRDALVEANRRLDDALHAQPGLAGFLATPIPAPLLDDHVLCWFDGTAYSPACGGAADPVRGDPGGR